MSQKDRHRILIVGGGTAGLVVASRLSKAGETGIAIIEPSSRHFYQPLFTLVGAGAVRREATVADEARYIPAGVAWIKDSAVEIDPDQGQVTTASGARIGYDFLVVAPGIKLDWDAIPGLREALDHDNVSTNYSYDYAPKTWRLIKGFRGGTALFHMPGTPIKCPGAPQKIMYLAADHFRRNGVSAELIFGSGTASVYGIKEYAAVLNDVIARYGIDARYSHELVEMHPEKNEAIFQVKNQPDRGRVTIKYDLMHVTPPQCAPDFIRKSPLVNQEQPGLGWVEVDQFTLRHKRFPNVFALGDVAGSPNSKTGASAMKQAPVVVSNLRAAIRGKEPAARYNGYVACPVVTAYGKMLLCEFDYSAKPTPTVPLMSAPKERYSMWLLKRYGLPWMYWNLMLRGGDVPFLGARAIRHADKLAEANSYA